MGALKKYLYSKWAEDKISLGTTDLDTIVRILKYFAFTPPIDYYRANFPRIFPKKVYEENVPLLFVHAGNDHYLTVHHLEAMKDTFKHIETVVIDGVGHFIQQEEPVKVNTLIMEFLEKNKL